ncbi:unnamed protein product [Triticum turgidum subsp. durum]|uniref:Uncharacterized protein n=1 Tax=Triticum turgidum subsp. durum TaxID=4567 RepID=A0A9R1BLI9_TRITD|nr:unnamed protein product [Triticum turgidum subsp. durum]
MTVPTSIKSEPDADDGAGKNAGGETLRAQPHKKRSRHCLPATPIQQPLFTPQATPPGISRADSSVDKWSEQPSATPTTTVKRELDADAGKDTGGKVVRRRRPYPQRPITEQAPTMWANRGRLGRLLHSHVRTHQWRDAAGVFSVLLPGIQRPDSFEEVRSILVDAMDIHRRLAQDSGNHGRRTYYHRTQKVFDVWIQRLMWLPTSAKPAQLCSTPAVFGKTMGGPSSVEQHELRVRNTWLNSNWLYFIFHKARSTMHTMQQECKDCIACEVLGNFSLRIQSILVQTCLVSTEIKELRASIPFFSLIAKDGLQKEPTLNLIHGLISYDKWYSGLPKDMQLERFDVYNESCKISMSSNTCGENGLQDSSDDNCSIDVDDASFPACSSESSINNGNIDKKCKIPKKSRSVYPVKENDSVDSQVKEEVVSADFRSVFFNTSDAPTCGLEQSLLPLRLKHAAGTSSDCFDSYWKYKSTPNAFYADAERCLKVALHSSPPVMAALLPLIQILLLGDKLKDALCELEKTCRSSTTALPFRLRGRLLEYFDQNQVSTISSCYEEALQRDPTCSYSVERLTEMHRKGYYNTTRLLERIVLHLDCVNGKPSIWEELVSCLLRLFSDRTTDYEDCISCNVEGDASIDAFSSLSSVFFEQHTRESWKHRCKWWMNRHFSQNIYMSETAKDNDVFRVVTGDCKLLASKASCASHMLGPGFPYVKAAKSYLSKQEAKHESGFLSSNMENSVKLLQSLEKLM